MIIKYHKRFIKAYHKLSAKEQKITDDRIRLFSKDVFAQKLENHALLGNSQGFRSINITGDYRAIYIDVSEQAVLFVRIGTHSQLYG